MEAYRKVIRRRSILLGLVILAATVGNIFDGLILDTARLPDIASFQFGVLTGLGLLALVKFSQYTRLLRDESKLKRAFCQEHDERRQAIRARAGMPVLLVTSCLMAVAAVVAGYFSKTICLTLLCAALCQLLIGLGLKLYYTRKL